MKKIITAIIILLGIVSGTGILKGQGSSLMDMVKVNRVFTGGGCTSGCSSDCRVTLLIDLVNNSSVPVSVQVRYQTSGDWGAMGSPAWETKNKYVRLKPRQRKVEELDKQPHWIKLETYYDGRQKRTCLNPFRDISVVKVEQVAN
jgi:hypothetical protein